MMKKLLSRYRPRYVRSLVYMLQASEYDVREYLAWLGRVEDFSAVEKRKQLVKTPKAFALLTLAWLTLVSWIIAVMGYANATGSDVPLVVGAIIIVLSPLYLPYLALIPLFIIRVIQLPIEYRLIRQARKKLETHPAIKIGIAGSFGKTTMREILKAVLAEGKKVAAPPKNHNTPLGISAFVKTLTGDEEVLIFELGEYYPGDVRALAELVRPDIGVITGVNEAHLQKFKTLERVAATIFELADYLGGKPVYVNGESEFARRNARAEYILYSRSSVGDAKVENPKTDLNGLSFTLVTGSSRLELSSSLLGLHQVGPLATAAAIAARLGLSPEQIRAGVAKTRPFDHRLAPATDAASVVTLDDSYNGNPDGVRAAIDFLAALAGRRRWYVTPGLVEMGARAEEVHRDIGRQLAQAKIEKVVLVRNSVTPFIERGLQEAGYGGEVLWFEEALQAFAALPQLTVTGDVVLLQNDWPDQYA